MTRIDVLFIRRPALSSNAFCPRRAKFRLPLLIVPIAALIYMVWPSSGQDHQAVTEPMTFDEIEQWSNFHEAVDETKKAQTLDHAFQALTHIRYLVNYLPYKVDRHEYDANVCLETAEKHLLACHVGRRTHPSYWRPQLSKSLSEIPTYSGRLDETPPGLMIDPL